MGDEYDYDDEPYQQTACEKFQDRFLYCFIPTLCLMFDASFITIGVICLASGSDDDFDKCSGDPADPELLEGLSENEVAGKLAGQPCLCQKVPGSGIALVVLGLFLLCISRIPPYLNRERHMLIISETGKSYCCWEDGKRYPCWCLTCRWMQRYDEDEGGLPVSTVILKRAADVSTGSPTPDHQV